MTTEPHKADDPRLARLERKVAREQKAREEAERLLEEKSRELYSLNEELKAQIENVEALRHSIDMATDGIALTDADGAFIYMNTAHAAMFDYRISELLGCSWSVLYSQAEHERIGSQIFPVLVEEGSWRGETTGLSKSGREILQEIVLTFLPSGGLICATRDISARRKREVYARDLETRLQKAEREAALFSLGNAVAHDFNNLIAAIAGNAALLKANLQDDFDNYYRANQIEVATQQAANVIRSLNVERSNDTAEMEPIDLSELVRTGLQIAASIKPSHVTVEAEIPDEAVIISNEVVLTRCLLNIVKNAFDATDKVGTVHLRIARDRTPDAFSPEARTLSTGTQCERPMWVIEITDCGCGIPEGKINHIFEDFFTTKPKLAGSGLGLQALRTLAEFENCFVEVESEEGVGTRFRLTFYEEAVSPQTSTVSKSPHPLQPSNPKIRIRVLLVDDNELVGRMLEDTLLNLKLLADWVDDPRTALSLIEDNPNRYDIVVTDLTMPYLDGQGLSRKIKAVREDLPIIIYSGQASLIEPSPIYASILQKPIDAEALDVAIRNAVSGTVSTNP